MSIYKRGGVYWYGFTFRGERIQASTKQSDRRVARQLEAAHRTRLAKGEAGIGERKPAPRLKEFAQRFVDSVQVRCAEKPATVAFYVEKLDHLLKFEPLANARLDQVDEALIENYVQERSKASGRRETTLAPATVNRDLATLRRALRLAYEWHVIDRVPKIHLLPGEQNREFTLSHAEEGVYLTATPQPLRDIALLTLDCGLRTSESLKLEWQHVHLEPAPGAKYGYIHVLGRNSRNGGKSKHSRNVPVTERVARVLLGRSLESKSIYVFPSETGRPYRVQSIDHLHRKVRDSLRLASDFVIYSLRHTYGTRLGEAGADAFEIMKLMGHSSVTISQRYVHPTPETLERAVERLQAMNALAAKGVFPGQRRQVPTTVSTTVRRPPSVSD